jgi:hypothetical protein
VTTQKIPIRNAEKQLGSEADGGELQKRSGGAAGSSQSRASVALVVVRSP